MRSHRASRPRAARRARLAAVPLGLFALGGAVLYAVTSAGVLACLGASCSYDLGASASRFWSHHGEWRYLAFGLGAALVAVLALIAAGFLASLAARGRPARPELAWAVLALAVGAGFAWIVAHASVI